jgi:hypothetical protein
VPNGNHNKDQSNNNSNNKRQQTDYRALDIHIPSDDILFKGGADFWERLFKFAGCRAMQARVDQLTSGNAEHTALLEKVVNIIGVRFGDLMVLDRL